MLSVPSGVILTTAALPTASPPSKNMKSTTYRLPALSKARSQGLYNPEAKILCPPSQVNLKISPPPLSLPDTNRLCAEALEQNKIAAPNATMLKNCPARPRADLNLACVSFVFIIAPVICYVWLFHLLLR